MNKSLTSRIVALVCLGLFTLQSFAGTVTGQVQNAAAGPVRNGTFSFTLTAPATVAGTATVVTSSVPCYTDGNGNVAGEPDPLLAPVLSVNLGSGTLAAATYFVKIWYFDGTGNSFVSPEASVSLVSPGTLNVLSPVKQPLNASGFRVGISTASGTETLQGAVTGVPGAWGNFAQSSALVAGTAMPGSNTTVCALRFNDELTPSFTCYDVGLASSTGVNIPGYPAYWYLAGGSAGTINVGSGTPQSNVCQGQGVVYPQAVLTLPPFNATQTINGGLNVTGNATVGGTLGVTGTSTFGVALASMLENICYADQQTGADIGAKVNACLTKIAAQTPPVGCVELPEGTWTWSTPTVYSAKNNFCLLGRGFFNTKVINGVTGAPANNMISLVNVNGAYVAGINISGNGATNVGHAISVISNDGTVHAAYHFLDMRCGDFDGNTGKDHAGATVAASCFYLWNVNGVSFDNVITFGNNIAGVSHGLFIDNDPTGGISPVNVIVAKNFKANSWGGDGIFERLGASTPFNCYGCDAEFNFGWGINATGFSGGGWHGGYMEHNNSGGINITSVSDGFSVDTSFFSNTFGNVPAIQFASVTHSKNVSIRDNSFAASAAVTYTCLVCVDIQDSVISNLNVDAFTGSTVTDFVKLTTGSARNSIDRLSPGQTALNGGTVTNLLNDTVNSQVLSSALAGAFPYLQSGITIVGSGQLARVLQIGTASTNGLNICGSDFSTNGDCVIIWQSVNGVPNTANIQVANNTNFSTTLNLQPSGGTVNIGTLKATVTVGSNTVTTAGTAVTNGTCQAQTGITITGSLTTDEAVANINAALPATWQTGIRWSAEVSAAGTCTVNLCNPTAGSITPAATAVRCTVTR